MSEKVLVIFKKMLHRAARLTDPLVNKKRSDIMSLILEPFRYLKGSLVFSRASMVGASRSS